VRWIILVHNIKYEIDELLRARVCPGRHISNESLGLMAASLLSLFDIRPGRDEAGNEIPLKYEIESDSILM
jgi:hypothetical protein